MTRPIKELKGFKKVFLKKSEIKNVEIELGWDELGFYNNNGRYVVEQGEFKIYLGNDCMSEEFITVNVI